MDRPVSRGEIWWADLPLPRGSEPGYRRPVLIVQDNSFNRSGLRTVIILIITSNLRIADAPGNVMVPARGTGLTHDSVVNVSQCFSLDRMYLRSKIGSLPSRAQAAVDAGLRRILGL